jgi:hypothetical protein
MQGPLVVPARSIKHHYGMQIIRQGSGKQRQEHIHGSRRDMRDHQREVLARGRPHGGKDVG